MSGNAEVASAAKAAVDPALPTGDAAKAAPDEAFTTTADHFKSEHPELVDKVVIPTVLTLVVAYSVLTSFATGSAWYTQIIFYIAGMISFWIWHAQAHHLIPWIPFNTKCHMYHKQHHWEIYPPEKFFGTKDYRANDADRIMSDWRNGLPLASSPEHEALIYVLAAVVLGAARFVFGASGGTLLAATFMLGVIGVLGNYLHMSMHVPNHWLTKYDWYLELRALHFVHHIGTTSYNYAIVNFGLDRLMNSYVPDQNPASRPEFRKKAKSASDVKGSAESQEHQPPQGISKGALASAFRASPLARALLSFDLTSFPVRLSGVGALARGWSAVYIRVIIVLVGLNLWFASQRYVEHFTNTAGTVATTVMSSDAMGDHGHQLLAPLHRTFIEKPIYADYAIELSSLIADLTAVGIIVLSVLGTSVRSMASALVVLFLRQVCEVVVQLPTPDGMIWRDPHNNPNLKIALPSLFVQYSGGHQFCFSLHVALSVVFCRELARVMRDHISNRFAAAILGWLPGIALIVFQSVVLLGLRAHWTIDVVVAILAGLYAGLIGGSYGRKLDAFLP